MSAEWISGERNWWLSICSSDFFPLQIDLKLQTSFGILRQFDALFLGDSYRKHTILHRVIAENISKAGSNDASNTKIVPTKLLVGGTQINYDRDVQTPGRMLAGAATAEILAGTDKDLSFVIGSSIQYEISIFAGAGVFSKGIEQCVGETSSLESLQELLGDNHVGIDVLYVQRCRNALYDCEFLDRGRRRRRR